MNPQLPKWIAGWLAISTVIVIWDALFVLFRPASFPGESLGFIWDFAYTIYMKVDHSYADADNHTVAAICMVSLLEACLVGLTLWHHRKGNGAKAHVLAMVVTSLTCAKTVLFFMVEAFSGFAFVGHNELLPLLFLYIIPNGIWILVPGFIAFTLGRKIVKWAPKNAA